MPQHTVLLPIEVPVGDRCWNHEPPYEICAYFDNEGGHPTCDLNLGPLQYEKGGVKKCATCLKLQPTNSES
jgi:hypothetical protein